jgi:hypothetical protein
MQDGYSDLNHVNIPYSHILRLKHREIQLTVYS